MLQTIPIPGLLILGTDTGVGKTLVAGAIADWFVRGGKRTGVCKPVATGCARRREGLVSEDAEFLAHHADARFPLHVICPQCYAEPLAPAVAAERVGQPLDWEAIDRSLQTMSRASDVMIVEGVGGVMVPMDERSTFLDVAAWLGLPAIVVARPGLGTINHTLLTLGALRAVGIAVRGVVINGYPTDTASVSEETNPRAIEKWGKTRILAIVPQEPFVPPTLPAGIVAAIDQADWHALARH